MHTGKKIIKLPRNKEGHVLKEFKANGTNYNILDANSVVGIKRLNLYTKFRTMLAFNLENFQGLFDLIKEMENNLGKMIMGDGVAASSLAASIKTLKDSLVDFGEAKYSISMILCTLFIVTDKEDLSTFDNSHAEKKIQDWETEGYLAHDFFLLALNFSDDYKGVVINNLGGGNKE